MFHFIRLMLAMAPAVVAQTEATCTNNSLAWTFNLLDQSSCYVADVLSQLCPPAHTLSPLSSGQFYTPIASNCTCNIVHYSLVSACAACQNGSWLSFSNYTRNCTHTFVQEYPETIPNNTSIPHWAYLPLSANGIFDIIVASAAVGSNSTALPTATSASTTTSSSTPNSGSGIVAIEGGAVGGVIGAIFIAGFLFWIYTRHKASQPNSQMLLNRRGILASHPSNGTPTSAQRLYQPRRLYNPSVPPTYPPTRDRLAQMNHHNAESFHGQRYKA